MYDELPRFVGVPFLCECNSCVCELDGTISATQIECKACSFLGKWYDAGESFLAQDGCNTCGCEADGNFGCTQIGCAGVEVPDYGRRFADKDPKACLLFDFACGLNTKHFSDETGCGCVQDRNCPQVIHCDGGIPNCVDGPIQCPFSKLE